MPLLTGTQRSHIREKTLEFSSTVLSTLSLYFQKGEATITTVHNSPMMHDLQQTTMAIIITMTMFMVLSSWPKSLREFTRFIWWMQTERRVAVNPQTKPVDLGCESAKNWQLPSTSTIAIVIITQPVGWYSFYNPTKGGRLRWPRHCSKGAQPMLNTVYRSSCRDKYENFNDFWHVKSWKIWHDNLTGLSVCLPHLSYVATLIKKSHFQQYMYYSYILRIIITLPAVWFEPGSSHTAVRHINH